MPIHSALFDFVTDFIPGGDIIDNVLGIGGGGQQLQPTSTLGSAEVLVPDFIERAIGTLPAQQPAAMGAGVGGCAITMPIQRRSVAHCAPGMVAVDTNGDGQTDMCMLKEVARACKLWRPRPKPVMTASDRRTLTRATSVMRKVDTVVKQTNMLRGQAKLTKSRPSRR